MPRSEPGLLVMCFNIVPPLTGHIPRVTFESVDARWEHMPTCRIFVYCCLPQGLGTYLGDSYWSTTTTAALYIETHLLDKLATIGRSHF